MRLIKLTVLALAFAASKALAGELSFSDPANTPPPPGWAIGFVNRDPDFNALPGFQIGRAHV